MTLMTLIKHPRTLSVSPPRAAQPKISKIRENQWLNKSPLSRVAKISKISKISR